MKKFNWIIYIFTILVLVSMSIYFGVMFGKLHRTDVELQELKNTMSKQEQQRIEIENRIQEIEKDDVIYSWSFDGSNWTSNVNDINN